MTRFSLVACAFLAFTALAHSEPAPSLPPTWHAADGQVLNTGVLSNVTGTTVQIQKADATSADLKLASLSLADRAFVLTNKDKQSEFQKPTRQWTSSGGSYHVDAKALSSDDKSIRLMKLDGKVANVPLDKLSKDDVSYLERLKHASTLPEADPFNGSDDNLGVAESFLGKPSTATQPRARTTAKVPVSGSTSRSKSDMAPLDPDSVDRNPNDETPTGQTATGIPTYTGPRGGTYHYSNSGNKVYSKKK